MLQNCQQQICKQDCTQHLCHCVQQNKYIDGKRAKIRILQTERINVRTTWAFQVNDEIHWEGERTIKRKRKREKQKTNQSFDFCVWHSFYLPLVTFSFDNKLPTKSKINCSMPNGFNGSHDLFYTISLLLCQLISVSDAVKQISFILCMTTSISSEFWRVKWKKNKTITMRNNRKNFGKDEVKKSNKYREKIEIQRENYHIKSILVDVRASYYKSGKLRHFHSNELWF